MLGENTVPRPWGTGSGTMSSGFPSGKSIFSTFWIAPPTSSTVISSSLWDTVLNNSGGADSIKPIFSGFSDSKFVTSYCSTAKGAESKVKTTSSASPSFQVSSSSDINSSKIELLTSSDTDSPWSLGAFFKS